MFSVSSRSPLTYSIKTSSSNPRSSMIFFAIQGLRTASSTLRMSTFVSNEGGNFIFLIISASLSANRPSWREALVECRVHGLGRER